MAAMRRWWVLALGLGACGRVGFDPQAIGGDASGDGSLVDGIDAAPLGPFTMVTAVTELNQVGVNTEDPTLTDDMLEIVVSSTRPTGVGGVDLWTATRASTAAPWGALALIASVSSTSDDTTPDLSGDGLTLTFASNRPGGAGLYDLYQSTRASRVAAWGPPVRIAELASNTNDFAGSITPGGLAMVISSNRVGGAGAADIYKTGRTSTVSPWGTPAVVAEVSSSDDDSAPYLSGDGLALWFSSTRAGGQGAMDIWASERPSTSSPWGGPTLVTELNGATDDSDPWLAPDRRTIFFARTIGALRNVFVATR